MANEYIIDGQRVSTDEYNKTKYEDLRVRVPRGQKVRIQSHAAGRGESVNSFIGRAIENQISRDQADREESTP